MLGRINWRVGCRTYKVRSDEWGCQVGLTYKRGPREFMTWVGWVCRIFDELVRNNYGVRL